MTVQITDPPDNSSFPYDEGWTATATIDSDDAVDGVLIDWDTLLAYPSPGPSLTDGPDGQGLYWWQVPFTPDANIQQGDLLEIYCYDAEIDDPGAAVFDAASQAGREPYPEQEQRYGGMPRGSAPSITITSAELTETKVAVKVKLTPQTKGGLFLLCANLTGDNHKHTRRTYVYCLQPLEDATRDYTFQDVDASQWTHILVIGVTYRNQGNPAVAPVKTPAHEEKAWA